MAPATARPAGRSSPSPFSRYWSRALVFSRTGCTPKDHRQSANPSFIDNIFASNLVIFIARVILLLGAGVLATGMYFVVLSIWKRAKAGHYLTRFGPFETQAVEDLRGEVETWQGYWAEENRKVVELNERIEVSDDLIAKLQEELREARGSGTTMRDQEPS